MTSGELSSKESTSYEAHLGECPTCTDEHTTYTTMKEKFFTPELLAKETTFLSLESLFANTKAAEQPVIILGLPLFTFLQQRVAPVFVLLVGIFVGYSLLPKEDEAMAVVAKKAPQETVVEQDSADVNDADSLREFREGGTVGITSVSETE